MSFFKELQSRELIHQVTASQSSDEDLATYLDKNKITLYAGFDPTAESLHIGSLLPAISLRRFQMMGHKPIAVLGGATGMIGDPSGKSQERSLLTPEIIAKNCAGVKKQLSKFIDFSGTKSGAMLVNNSVWFQQFSYIDFLRDIGKHFTVNHMMAKDSVKSRLEDRDHGISYTEFSYMLLQAYDFYHLYKNENCTLQIGGSDQWGNITAGTELIRRMLANAQLKPPHVFGMTMPLVLKSDGTKFGKTESGAIWLDSRRTSPYQFYQYFLQTSDHDVVRFLKYFTFLSLDQIKDLEESVANEPEKREAQNKLAEEVTKLVHGADDLNKAKIATKAMFGEEIKNLDRETFLSISVDMPSTQKPKSSVETGVLIVELLFETGLCKSKGMAKQDIQGGGIYMNNERITDVAFKLSKSSLIAGQYVVLRKGKKTNHLVSFE